MPNLKKVIILIAGKKGSGKDYTANYIAKDLPDSAIIHFSDPLKEILCKTFNIDLNELNRLKNSDDEVCFGLTMRNILQRLGTDACQSIFGNDFWARLALKRIAELNCKYVIIPDFRFVKEFSTLLKYYTPVVTILVETNKWQNDKHISENQLSNFWFDYKVQNFTNISNEVYFKKLHEICSLIKEQVNSGYLA